ncbi:MAG: hypothetical protein GX757_08675 [Clostridiales bacterium]|nr:hypothetical protein [Clostridiales bacterium]
MKNRKRLIIGIAFISLFLVTGILIRGRIVNREHKLITTHIENYIKDQLSVNTTNEDDIYIKEKFNSDELNELILTRTQIHIVKISDLSCVLAVTSPDCAYICKSILKSSDKWDKSDFNASKAYVMELFRQELESPSCPIVTNEIELKIVKNHDRYEIEESEAYFDALYGGLISYYKELSEALQKEDK